MKPLGMRKGRPDVEEHMEAQTTSWRLFLRPYELGWWMWLTIAGGRAVGIAGYPSGFLAAMGISLAKAVFIVFKYRSPSPLQRKSAWLISCS
jgi:hypothetical protein